MTKKASAWIDIPELLAPIPGKRICGESLRYTDVYDKIREARREEDEDLPQGIWKTDLKKADWDQVHALCQDALQERTKDLQIAIWLTEARLHLNGVEGLAQGLDLILGLTKKYWDSFYPQMSKGSYELRLGLYDWVNLRLSEEIHFAPVTAASDKVSSLDLNEVKRLDSASKTKQQSENGRSSTENSFSHNTISLNTSHTSTPYYVQMNKSCALVLKLLTKLKNELQLRLGGEAPSFYRLKEKIEDVRRFVSQLVETKGAKKKLKQDINDTESKIGSPQMALRSSIETREQAYAILGEVAIFLESIEPHSPTPYLIQRAISWGGMNLSQVVSNVLDEEGNLSLLLDILNVKKEQS